MVGACQQNSGIFLVRGGGPDEMPAGAGGRLGQNAGGGQGRDWTRCRRGPRLEPGLGRDTGGAEAEPGLGRDTGGAEAEQAGSKSTQKNALYNILQQFWIFQILLSCNDQIAVL